MKLAVFDTRSFDEETFQRVNSGFGVELHFFKSRLSAKTAKLAAGFEAVCPFVNDRLDAETLDILSSEGVKLLTLRSAGFNHVDLDHAKSLGMTVTRVPEYSPHAVAEHALALLLTLNRKIHRSYNRVRELNFSLEGLVGFDLYKKKMGVCGTGKIGEAFARIAHGFGCEVLALDKFPNESLVEEGILRYVSKDEILEESDVLSLHLPLNEETLHFVDENAFAQMKEGAVLVNTSRGALVETKALIGALKSRHLGAAALDVYEEEEGVFFNDLSSGILEDDQLARLLTFPNTLITSHQAFLTREALQNIAETTLNSVKSYFSESEYASGVRL